MTDNRDKLSEAGRKGGKARMALLEPEERRALASAAAQTRWGRPTAERTVGLMVQEIYRRRRPMALYQRDGALWFAPPENIESPRWTDYLVGTYGVGVMEEDVLADVAQQC